MTDFENNKIGKKLYTFLEIHNISPLELAEQLEVSSQYVYNVLKGKPLGKKAAEKWGKVLGIKPSWLLTGEGEMLINESGPTAINAERKNSVLNSYTEIATAIKKIAEDNSVLIRSNETLVNTNARMVTIIDRLTEKLNKLEKDSELFYPQSTSSNIQASDVKIDYEGK